MGRGLVVLLVGLGQGASSRVPPLPPRSPLEMVTSACESLTADQRLHYVLPKLRENGVEDQGVPAVSQDGKYVDFGEECAAYSDHLGEQMHIRAWYSLSQYLRIGFTFFK